MCNELSRLERVELREVWPNEAADFTPWLAEEENLSILAETLNMELELEGSEVNVESGIVDLLCRRVDNSVVLIENQLEETDPDHLERILAYAASLDADTVIWIAKKFKDEHRAVFDRQNAITDERYQYFGVEIELWRIGDSLPAPEFNIVSKPNDWIRTVSQEAQRAANENLSETQLQQKRFWTGLREHMDRTSSPVRCPLPRKLSFLTFSIGRTNFSMVAWLGRRAREVGIRIYTAGPDATAHFHFLMRDRAEIERECEEQLEWEELPQHERSRISLHKSDTDPTDEADWPNQHAWLAEKLKLFDNVFGERIQDLDADDWQSEDEDDE